MAVVAWATASVFLVLLTALAFGARGNAKPAAMRPRIVIVRRIERRVVIVERAAAHREGGTSVTTSSSPGAAPVAGPAVTRSS